MKNNVCERQNTPADVGLTAQQVQQRIARKQTNRVKKVVGKSYLQIFASNIFTFFNLLGIIIFVLMLICQSFSNMMFIVVILANTLIGIVQEIRSKITVEKLAIVSQPTAQVVRDGIEQTISTDEIVLDDVILLGAGKQICCDGVLLSGLVEVDESMLTGESDAVKKHIGDTLFSGSFVVSGSCVARCDKVGKDNYIEQLSARVKRAKMPDSQLIKGIKTIIKAISVVIFPLGIATFFCSEQIKSLLGANVNAWQGYFDGVEQVVNQVNKAIEVMSGSMLGMVPSGMVLLTSVALAVAALKLAKRKVLVRELPCIEMLARVDTLCLDKTGTITDGTMTVQDIVALDGDVQRVKTWLSSLLTATADDNFTATAVKKYLGKTPSFSVAQTLPFSSSRKYSAVTLSDGTTIAMGASEFMFDKVDESFENTCKRQLSKGLRVLAVGVSNAPICDDKVTGLVPVAMIVLQDTVRQDAPEIIGWFKQNNVEVKVISGDNPLSVSVIAQKVGVANADKYVSLEGLTDEQVSQVATQYTVFGRVTPEQKAILVRSMKKSGCTVAMTGDGVNDILAMRESDCAISVGCGSDAAKTVANLVLLDNKFGSLPKVVAEGRQVVNNTQNSTSLFLMKTTMTILTTILCLVLGFTYPFAPKHLYVIEFFVIGISSFMLTFKRNEQLIRGRFLYNTIKNMLPSGIAMFLSVALTYAFANALQLSVAQISTVAMLSMTATGVIALWILMYPLDCYDLLIGGISTAGSVGCFFLLPPLLSFVSSVLGEGNSSALVEDISATSVLFVILLAIAMGALIVLLKWVVRVIDGKNANNA